jgi:phosphoglucomutase
MMNLKFGTGGLRATMAPGPDHLNTETIQEATLGVAAYAKTLKAYPGIAIAYDSRKNSEDFAKETARVLALKGCQVFLYPKLMPTPALSFAVRDLKCDLGIAITASHNPKDYNGYKVYGSDGGQITSEAAKKIQKEIELAKIEEAKDWRSFEDLLKERKIVYIDESTKEAFLQSIRALRTRKALTSDLKVVYTPLHGAGIDCVTEILTSIGLKNLYVVEEQQYPDGEFPTCPFPNPEEEEALTIGIQYCKKYQADILIATDPDSDRVGVAALKDGKYERLTGNQVGVLLLDYLLKWHKANGTLPKNPVAVKTIVTTALGEKIANSYGVEVINTLTGFKYIGEQIGYLEQVEEVERYVFGFEESCGYLIGPYVRDKDAVGASMLVCEMADAYKAEGKTLWDVMEEIYQTYGYHTTHLKTYAFTPEEAKRYMEQLRVDLAAGKQISLGTAKVVKYLDYIDGIDNLPKSNVLKLWMSDGEEIVVRPSGTEPKIKIYKETVS